MGKKKEKLAAAAATEVSGSEVQANDRKKGHVTQQHSKPSPDEIAVSAAHSSRTLRGTRARAAELS